MNRSMKDYYKVLGLRQDAPEAEIHQAFRKLAIQYHPDRNPGPDAQKRFSEINEAYQVLRDASKRRTYDALVQSNNNQVRHASAEYKSPAYYADPARQARMRRAPAPWLQQTGQAGQLLIWAIVGSVTAIIGIVARQSIEGQSLFSLSLMLQAIFFGVLAGLVLPTENGLLLKFKGGLKDGYHLVRAMAATLSGVFFGSLLGFLLSFQLETPYQFSIYVGMLLGAVMFGWISSVEAFWAKVKLPKAYFELFFVLVRILGVSLIIAGVTYLIGVLLAGYGILTEAEIAAFYGGVVGVIFGSVSPSDLRAYARYASAYASKWVVWLIVVLAVIIGFVIGVWQSVNVLGQLGG